MTSLKDIIKICEADGGKFFILNDAGEVKLVILGIDDYQKVFSNKQDPRSESNLNEPVKNIDIEDVNRKITEAQLVDEVEIAEKSEKAIIGNLEDPLSLKSIMNNRFKDWPKDYSVPKVKTQSVNSEETIDPSFDLEGPKNSFIE